MDDSGGGANELQLLIIFYGGMTLLLTTLPIRFRLGWKTLMVG